MMSHPYTQQPSTAKWSRSVSRDWDPRKLIPADTILLRKADWIASLGSCFAANIVPYLKESGLRYVVAEPRLPGFSNAPRDNFSYEKFSAAYGNVYTARQFRQLLDRAFGRFAPREDRWRGDGAVIDPFRPGLTFKAKSDDEFDALTAYHLSRVRLVFETANVIIFTLGLTEAWYSKLDGAVFPACPGTVAGAFDPDKHAFYNFSVAEVVDDLIYICNTLRTIRADVRLILTVSPVPLVATATAEHVLVASTYSKAVLRVACKEAESHFDFVTYFPSYEIISGPQAPWEFFEADRRNASWQGIDQVMDVMLSRCEVDVRSTPISPVPAAPMSGAARLCALVGETECEEAAADA